MNNMKLSTQTPELKIGGRTTKEHNKLQNLDYEHSGHTGFQKELSQEQLLAIDDVKNKVPKEDGKGLSTNDYTDAEKEILFDILSGILDLGKLGTHQLKIGLPEMNEFITIDSKGISGTLPFTIDCQLGQLINCCGVRSEIIEYMDVTGKWVVLNHVIYNLQDGLASVRGDIEDIKPFVVETETELEKFKYYGTSNIEITDPSLFTFDASTGTITGYIGTETDIVIPCEIDGVKVVSIGESAFFNSRITSVVMPNSIINMGKYAFMSSIELLNVTLSNKLVSISDSVFEGCTKLAEITIPDSVTSIGNRAFELCESLSNITLSKTLTYIGTTAFIQCPFTSITFPASLTRIDGGAFHACNNLTDVYYEGTKEQWNNINLDNGNDPILNATIHYEQVPTTKGYVDEQIGDIETVLDNIIAIQTSLIGGES